MKQKNNPFKIDFFGMNKPRPKPGKLKMPKPSPNKVSFLGGKVKPVLQPGIFKKESVTSKHLSKWGDADMDGSPNYFDCDPRNVMKDAKNIKRFTLEQQGIKDISKPTAQELIEQSGSVPPTKKERKLIKAKEEYARLKEAAKYGGLGGKKRIQEEIIRARLEKGKIPSKKEISKQVELEKKVSFKEKVPGSLKKIAEYKRTKEQLRRQQRLKRATKGALGALFGSEVVTPRPMGRPRGPSGRYRDFQGKPIYEQEAQDYQAKQRALNRLLPSDVQSAPMPPVTQNVSQDVSQELPPEQTAAEQLSAAPSQTRSYSEEEINQIQLAQQQNDNVLNAPNISKGELTNVGGPNSIMNVKGKTILEAPDMMKGQLRNIMRRRGEEVPAVTLSERPQTNPYGDEYIEIDPVSGKPMLMRRPREKWMTGEAL